MRTVAEWIGWTDDARPPFKVRLRVFARAHGRCVKCDHKIEVGERWQIDHRKPIWLGGENREGNMQLLCATCHKFKTGREAAVRAKTDRVRAKHLGLKKDRTIRAWRKFDGTKVFAPRQR